MRCRKKEMAFLRLFWQLVLLAVARAWLNSSGTDIISATTETRVRLRCVNWYGAHLETFVAGGLDKRSCAAITNTIVSIGANCVRIPLSVQLVLTNPAPPAWRTAAVNTSECNVSTALDVLDCQVQALTRRGLMVILNNHNSFAGWVGSNERVPQGLWHSADFPTSAWVASLALLASRYNNNSLVVGIDIRNEIHDQDGTVITWGTSDDVDSDWKAATMLADAAIRDSNPEMLVIVSGLARGYDLRAMQDLENYRSKYVFTTHVYTFSWWFTRVDWVLIWWLSLLFLGANIAILLYVRRQQRRTCTYVGKSVGPVICCAASSARPSCSYVFAGALLPAVYLVAVSAVWIQEAQQAGCSSIAQDAHAPLSIGIVWLLVVAMAWLVLETHENVVSWSKLVTCVCLWNIAVAVTQAALSMFYQTYWAVLWDMRRWYSRDIPVWVGEFGTVVGDTSVAWGWLMTYIADMHYAYWPLNGCAYPFASFHNDTYGLLDCDWATIRNVNWTRTIFPVEN